MLWADAETWPPPTNGQPPSQAAKMNSWMHGDIETLFGQKQQDFEYECRQSLQLCSVRRLELTLNVCGGLCWMDVNKKLEGGSWIHVESVRPLSCLMSDASMNPSVLHRPREPPNSHRY